MCEYCGCQSLTVINELTREHDVVVGLVAKVRSADGDGDVVGMAALARQIAAILGPHTNVEEHGLFHAMAAEFPDHINTLRAEHRRIEAVLDEARLDEATLDEARRAVPADPTWAARLMHHLDLLRDHILKEQDGLFPAALATLSAADWEAVEAVRSRVGTLLPGPQRPAMQITSATEKGRP